MLAQILHGGPLALTKHEGAFLTLPARKKSFGSGKSGLCLVHKILSFTRPTAGTENSLMLDFAGNVRRFGPIDLVRPKRSGEAGGGDAPTKARGIKCHTLEVLCLGQQFLAYSNCPSYRSMLK